MKTNECRRCGATMVDQLTEYRNTGPDGRLQPHTVWVCRACGTRQRD